MQSLSRCLAFFVVFTLINFAKAEEVSPNVHLVAITIGHYAQSDNSGTANLSGAHVSGRLLLNELNKRLNPVSSVHLRSSEEQLISRDDVFSIFSELRQRVRKTSGQDFVFVYLMAHGYGEGIGWNQFLQPSDIGLSRIDGSVDVNEFNVIHLSKQLIYIAELVDLLKSIGANYMVLIDACYEGNQVSVSNPVFTQTNEQNIGNILGILKAFNQFRENDAVVFASEPGKTVQTVSIPNAKGVLKKQKIGPLSRRMLISLGQYSNGRPLDVADLVSKLTSSSLDSETSPSISFHTNETPISLKRASGSPSQIQVRFGSSTLGDFQMASFEPNALPDSEVPLLPSVIDGRFTIVGSISEYISDGQDWDYDGADGTFSITSLSKNYIALSIEGKDADWSVELATPNGKEFEKGRYDNAQNAVFRDEDAPGISISGSGRGCSDNFGSFTVHSVIYSNGNLSSLDVSIIHACLDEGIPIQAKLQLELTALK